MAVSLKPTGLWDGVSDEEWQDWRWQVRNRVTKIEELKQIINLTPEEERGLEECLKTFRMAITPYYASLMDADRRDDPVRMQAVPTVNELHFTKADMDDPLHEDIDSPAPGLTHRYPDRVLLLITDQCSMYCRHCTRRRYTGVEDRARSWEDLEKCFEYIERSPEVRDVVLSGGDALLVGDEQLERILKRLRQIDHVEILRLGTRTPVVLPQRITPELVEMLKRYHPIYVNTHFNHPKELTEEAKEACRLLVDAGIPVSNQTVLLRGINDCPVVMKELVHELLKVRVRPYYLFQCDLSKGLEHFRTPVDRGIEIIEMLRGHTSGLAIPTLAIDAPGGGGKIPIGPQYMISRSPGRVVLRNYEGVISVYTEPAPRPDDVRDVSEGKPCPVCGTDHSTFNVGVGKLFSGKEVGLEPADLERRRRKKRESN